MKILVLSLSDLGRDPRVYRQLRALSPRHEVVAAGLAAPGLEGVTFVPISYRKSSYRQRLAEGGLLLLGLYDRYYWSRGYVASAMSGLANIDADVIVANDLNMLPLALKLAKNNNARVVLDAHEYAPLEFDDWLMWRLFFKRYADATCKRYLPQVHGMMTVCEGIAREYRRCYGVQSVVVTNAPEYQDLSPSLLEPNIVRMVHHGGCMPSRHLDTMIEMMEYLDHRFTLDFMLVPSDPKYLSYLKGKAKGDSRIRFIDPVPMQSLSRFINKYDIGLYLLPPNNFNNAHALPNKFFEFIQARLAVAIGPSPEMASLVKKYDCGIVSSDFSPESLAAMLSKLTHEQISSFKEHAHLAAADLCAEKNKDIILRLVEES